MVENQVKNNFINFVLWTCKFQCLDQEGKQGEQETEMAEQGPADQIETQEGNSEAVEAGTCGLGIVQGCCPEK